MKRGRPKKEPTQIHSIRASKEIKEFLTTLDNTNEFILNLIKNSDEFKAYITLKKSLDNTPTLFDDFD